MNEEKQVFELIKSPEGEKTAKQLGHTLFELGEIVEFKGERFEITLVSRKRITLKPEGW